MLDNFLWTYASFSWIYATNSADADDDKKCSENIIFAHVFLKQSIMEWSLVYKDWVKSFPQFYLFIKKHYLISINIKTTLILNTPPDIYCTFYSYGQWTKADFSCHFPVINKPLYKKNCTSRFFAPIFIQTDRRILPKFGHCV